MMGCCMDSGRKAWLVGAALSLMASAACGDGPTTPTPIPTPTPTPPAPTLACPADMSGVSHLNQPVTVTWTEPAASGGTAPVTVACTPASGATFPAGTTTVTCRGTDAAGQSATCAFWVTITRVPMISATRFVAFGDSITWGKTASGLTWSLLDPGPAISYPYKLRGLLSARYADQTIEVANEGVAGEKTDDGLYRLGATLSRDNAEAVLLLEGANDLNNDGQDAINDIIRNLQAMVRYSKSVNVKVLLSTFPPQDVNGFRGRAAPYVPEVNRGIADLALQENVTLVDTYDAFPSNTAGLIDVDGLHLTDQGYTLMAQAFYRAVTASLEVAPAATAGSSAPPDAVVPAARPAVQRSAGLGPARR
jgi:lysophospholipase L1-like esterase